MSNQETAEIQISQKLIYVVIAIVVITVAVIILPGLIQPTKEPEVVTGEPVAVALVETFFNIQYTGQESWEADSCALTTEGACINYIKMYGLILWPSFIENETVSTVEITNVELLAAFTAENGVATEIFQIDILQSEPWPGISYDEDSTGEQDIYIRAIENKESGEWVVVNILKESEVDELLIALEASGLLEDSNEN